MATEARCFHSVNAVTSPETVLNGNSVKTMLYKTPYFILLASSVKTLEVKAIECHIIVIPVSPFSLTGFLDVNGR